MLRTRIILGIFTSAALAVLGCGTGTQGNGQTTSATTTTTGGTTTTSTTAGTGGAGGSGSTTTATTGSGGAGGATTTSGSGGSGGNSGGPCGGKMGLACPGNEYCDYPDDICGAADGTGTCTPRPQGCPDIYQPTCACDGMVYSSPCDAAAAGKDVNNNGGCAAPPGLFPCGPGFCNKTMEYCQKTLTDVGGTPDSYQCVPVPAGCGSAPSCGCLGNVPCGPSCVVVPDGGLIVTCGGG
ncbi:MAG: hypothetical protein U0359_39055 [Byssovorax sp.]